uniref:Uncharacterized protein n=1 Tax=Romanomermis culicivorax TaxID=13658 RepID=A0A915HSJ2_ROMCU
MGRIDFFGDSGSRSGSENDQRNSLTRGVMHNGILDNWLGRESFSAFSSITQVNEEMCDHVTKAMRCDSQICQSCG